MNKHCLPPTYIPVNTSKSQPKTTRPAKPRKSCLSLIKKEQEIIVFILELFKDNIKNNISIQNIFNLILVSLKY
jgi:hypothetical protein